MKDRHKTILSNPGGNNNCRIYIKKIYKNKERKKLFTFSVEQHPPKQNIILIDPEKMKFEYKINKN
ncbi:MAG: hypothetical protein GY730_07410 [bacterium]|nr:hypothetical protein [bacterium]